MLVFLADSLSELKDSFPWFSTIRTGLRSSRNSGWLVNDQIQIRMNFLSCIAIAHSKFRLHSRLINGFWLLQQFVNAAAPASGSSWDDERRSLPRASHNQRAHC